MARTMAGVTCHPGTPRPSGTHTHAPASQGPGFNPSAHGLYHPAPGSERGRRGLRAVSDGVGGRLPQLVAQTGPAQHPCAHRAQGALRPWGHSPCAWPLLPRLVTRRSPPHPAKRGAVKFAHLAHNFRTSLFLEGVCNSQLTSYTHRGHPPSPENASCRPAPPPCTPAGSRRRWG